MNLRTTKPGAGNKYFIRNVNGGYSWCIQGKPTDSECNVLANCVGYACGAYNEEHDFGYEKYHLNCNAENFIERAIASGLSVYQKPMPGGIMVWQKGATLNSNDGAGHVAICTWVNDIYDPVQIKTSESGYGSSAFWRSTRDKGNGNWGQNSNYKYRGCIAPVGYVPPVKPEPTPEPPRQLKYHAGDRLRFTGVLYADSYGNGPGQSRENLDAVISAVNDNAKATKPYNINRGLGWVAEEDLHPFEPAPQPTPTVLNVGDKVKIIGTGNGASDGSANTAYGIGWIRYIKKIYPGRAFPYQVGDNTGTTGFYKANALEKL